MNLESLANELLLDLFEFLTAADIIDAFDGLNSRFDSLVLTHICAYSLDFRSVSKGTFDRYCREHLSSIVDRIISLRISNDDDTPQQIDLLFSHSLTLRQFVHLQSLSICSLSSLQTMNKVLVECCYLPRLIHLTFIRCYFECNNSDILNIFNSIWRLPKLTHCHLDISFNDEDYSLMLSVVSSSIQHVSIQGKSCHFDELILLCQHTPRIRHLCVKLNCRGYDMCSYSVGSIIALRLSEVNSLNLRGLLVNTPNLCHLTIKTLFNYVSGQEWEVMIINHLPKLRTFRMKMQFNLNNINSKKEQVDKILNSFRSRFWLDEHRWLVCCHWSPYSGQNKSILYTLPYAFIDFDSVVSARAFHFKSTCSQDDHYIHHDYVGNLCYAPSSLENLALPCIRFPKINNLLLTFPLEVDFWPLISNLDQFTSLEVSLSGDNNMNEFQLKKLLDQAPHLSSLSFRSWSWLAPEIPQVENKSISIRRLDFRGHDEYGRWRVFNEQQCIDLTRSSLAVNCQVLAIEVENRANILYLINSLTKLRALNVQCQDDKWIGQLISEDDELVDWLRYRLPPTNTITRDLHSVYEIRLWIR